MTRLALTPVLIGLLAGSGCAPSDPHDLPAETPTDSDSSNSDSDSDTEPTWAPPDISGSWALTSELKPGIDVLVPATYAGAFAALTALGDNPARGLFDLAEMAGAPAVGTLRDALPSYLEDKLEGWINDELEQITIDGVPITEHLAELAAQADQLRTAVELETTLDIAAADATGSAEAQHRLEAVVLLALSDEPIVVPASIADAIGTDELWVRVSSDDPAVSLSEHSFTLPIGQYLNQAVDELAARQFDAGDLRGALGVLIDCPSLGAAVADTCYVGQCVGHEEELVSICEAGLDEAAAQVSERLAAIDIDAVSFEAGHATLAGDQLTGGTWTATMDAGNGARPVPATFTGQRLAR